MKPSSLRRAILPVVVLGMLLPIGFQAQETMPDAVQKTVTPAPTVQTTTALPDVLVAPRKSPAAEPPLPHDPAPAIVPDGPAIPAAMPSQAQISVPDELESTPLLKDQLVSPVQALIAQTPLPNDLAAETVPDAVQKTVTPAPTVETATALPDVLVAPRKSPAAENPLPHDPAPAIVPDGPATAAAMPSQAQISVPDELESTPLLKDRLVAPGRAPLAHTPHPKDLAVTSMPKDLFVAAGKSLVVESPLPIERVSVGFGDVAEATAVSPREVLLNGKTPGITSLIIWQRGGGKLLFDVTVAQNSFPETNRLETITRELRRELPDQNIELSYENETVFLRGRVKDVVSAERAVAIANTMGKTVNLLYVDVPPAEQQILLKVRFATIDRSASLQLGFNLASTNGAKTVGSLSTQQFSPPGLPSGASGGPSVSDALNVFLFRPDLNLLATIQALESKSLMQVLAEPNVLAMNGKSASFLAGGEFPFPIFQTGANGFGTVTVQFREFGVRLTFTPVITPRGTIRLQVAPEVSALDFTDGLTVQGFTVPALTIRKVNTEIELAQGQSFAIGGLIDNRITQTNDKIPILGDLPGIGKLFQSKSRLRTNTELVVIVTPVLVSPLPAGQPVPGINFPTPVEFPKVTSGDANIPVPESPREKTIPFESLIHSMQAGPPDPPPGTAPSAAGQGNTGQKLH